MTCYKEVPRIFKEMKSNKVYLKNTMHEFFSILESLENRAGWESAVEIKADVGLRKFEANVLRCKHEMVAVHPDYLQIAELLPNLNYHMS